MELKTLFGEIADAIREKDGTQGEITASAFPERIRAISSGGAVLDRIEISAPPEKTGYYVGERFAPAGMVVTAVYSNGARLDVADYSVEPAGVLTEDVTEMTIRYAEGGISASVPVPVTVSRITVEAEPRQKGTLTYTGAALSPVWEGYDPAQLTLDGAPTGTNAGSYTASFTPKEGYQWADGSVAAKTVPWTIGKAAGSLTLSAGGVVLNDANLTASVNVTRLGDGAITAVSSNTGVAAVSVSGAAVTIQHVNRANGTATVTIRVAEGTNYAAPANKTVAVTVQFLPAKKALNNMTWAEIRAVSDSGRGSEYFNVGDRKEILVKGTVGTLDINETLYVYILGFDHNSAREGKGIHFGTFKNALSGGRDVCLVDADYGTYQDDGRKAFNMSHWGNYNHGGWKACDLRYDVLGSTNQPPDNYGRQHVAGDTGYDATAYTAINPVANTLMAALPSDLRAVMKPITKYTDNVGGGTEAEAHISPSVDYLPLLSEYETFGGSRKYASQYEKNYQEQYAYFSAGNSKMKYQHSANARSGWHGRSPRYSGSGTFCGGSVGGAEDYNNVSYPFGLAPVFMV